MAVNTPIDLALADPVPDTVRVLALGSVPVGPYTLAEVQAAALSTVDVVVEWDTPQQAVGGKVITRTLTLGLESAETFTAGPVAVLAIAIVNTEGDGTLFGVFELDAPVVFEEPNQQQEVPCWIQAGQL